MIFYYCTIFIIVCALPSYEAFEHREIQSSSNCWNVIKLCPVGFSYNKQNCSCDNQSPNNSDVVAKLITNNYRRTQSVHRNCGDGLLKKWNGSACVSSAVLCPGGYQWNGDVCVIQQSMYIRASVPAKCNKQSQTLSTTKPVNQINQIEEVDVSSSDLDSNESTKKAHSINFDLELLPPPIYTSSPLCSFGYVRENNECRKTAPICPENYVFAEGKCLRRSFPNGSFININHNTMNKWRKRSIQSHNDNLEGNGQPCCTIASPRYCRQITPNNWQCFHHKVKGCGNICVKPVIFLRPKRQMWTGNLLVMTPPSQRLASIFHSNRIQRERKIGKYWRDFFSFYWFFFKFKVLFVILNRCLGIGGIYSILLVFFYMFSFLKNYVYMILITLISNNASNVSFSTKQFLC